MQLKSLRAKNFWGFESLQLELHPEFNLFIGPNGAGKTSVLEAASVAIGSLFLGLEGEPTRNLHHEEVRRVTFQHEGLPDVQPQYPTIVECSGTLADSDVTWSRSLASSGGRTTRRDAAALQALADSLQASVQAGEGRDLPVIAYYGTQRLWKQIKTTDRKRRVGSRGDGYRDCLNPASNHKHLVAWLRKQALAAAQSGSALPHVAAVERAVVTCVSTATAFHYDILHEEPRVVWDDGGVLPFHLLSDGYRNMVAMIAGLAWRAAVLNPHHGKHAAERARGVVLIDELDLHLHPAWQRRVIGDLRRTFPHIQFLATTHSPQVVSTAKPEWVHRISTTGCEGVTRSRGRDSNSLLEDLFDVSPRPEDQANALRGVFALIDDERYEDASGKLAALEDLLGPDDPDVAHALATLALERDEP